MKTVISTVLLSIALTATVAACGKKGGGGIKDECEANFAAGEMENDVWSPGKGDKVKFMEYCLKQKPEVVKCSSMKVEFGDKSCEKHTGISTDGFKVKMELSKLRNGQ
jgi:hypothetical protein